jgi:hypothetical protein
MTGILITAHNPKGLDYNHLASSPEDAKSVVLRIIHQGGTDIMIGGRPLPEETRAFIAGINK